MENAPSITEDNKTKKVLLARKCIIKLVFCLFNSLIIKKETENLITQKYRKNSELQARTIELTTCSL